MLDGVPQRIKILPNSVSSSAHGKWEYAACVVTGPNPAERKEAGDDSTRTHVRASEHPGITARVAYLWDFVFCKRWVILCLTLIRRRG